MKNEIKFNVFYGTEDFEKLFNNLIKDKIKSVTGYSTNLSDRDFLKKISDDYNYLSMQ